MKTIYDWFLLVSILAIIYQALRLDWIGRLADKLVEMNRKYQEERTRKYHQEAREFYEEYKKNIQKRVNKHIM